jgi:uncharacterized membrane protein YgdD (TMEM256/DUF423 family)
MNKQIVAKNWFFKAASLNMLGLVGMGAIGGHNYHWQQYRKERFQTAQLYHLVTAIGMYMIKQGRPLVRKAAFVSMLTGLVCFVGPLYWVAFKEDQQLPVPKHILMPTGGVALMLGYGLLVLL